MRVLVTGGAGFIGSHVVDALLGEHTVAVLDDFSTGSLANLGGGRREGLDELFELDVCSARAAEAIVRWRPEVIVHLAAQVSVPTSVMQPVHDLHVNALGLLNVASAATALLRPSKIVFAASCAIYGFVEAARLPITEDQPTAPSSPYGISKASALQYLRFFNDHRSLPFSALVLANVYGPRQQPGGEAGVVASFCAALTDDQPVVIHGDGSQTRDFVYVEDVADAVRLACTTADAHLINVGSGRETSVIQLYRSLSSQLGREGEIQWVRARPSDPHRSVLAIDRARTLLGWSPTTSLDDGLRQTLAANQIALTPTSLKS